PRGLQGAAQSTKGTRRSPEKIVSFSRNLVLLRHGGNRVGYPGRSPAIGPYRRRVGEVLLFMADLRRPALAVKRANRRIEIERGALDVLEALNIPRALVDAGGE